MVNRRLCSSTCISTKFWTAQLLAFWISCVSLIPLSKKSCTRISVVYVLPVSALPLKFPFRWCVCCCFWGSNVPQFQEWIPPIAPCQHVCHAWQTGCLVCILWYWKVHCRYHFLNALRGSVCCFYTTNVNSTELSMSGLATLFEEMWPNCLRIWRNSFTYPREFWRTI